ncbi:hypothetical protein IJI31_02890 [bacterium]|nr:hypothetical protein [bacterium]
MYISQIASIRNNIGLNKKSNSPQFKGTVSPEFVEYVDTLRGDCLDTYPKQFSDRINNLCDNIMNKAQRVMQNCFPPESVLSVDTNTDESYDTITYSNKVIKKYIPGDLILGELHKKHKDTPIERLKRLHQIVFDKDRFSDACNKDYAKVDAMTYEGADIFDKNFVKDFVNACIPIVEFYHDNFNLYDSEMTDANHYNERTQAEYAELLSKMKELSD